LIEYGVERGPKPTTPATTTRENNSQALNYEYSVLRIVIHQRKVTTKESLTEIRDLGLDKGFSFWYILFVLAEVS